MIKFLTGKVKSLDNLSPALQHAERICEMKAIIAQSRCVLWDAEADSSRKWIAERFINKHLGVVSQKLFEIENEEPVLNQRIASFN